MNTQLAVDRDLYWQIMQTAQFLFCSKGFDHTTVEDITSFLNIKDSQFLYFFDSLDEVLELLWAGEMETIHITSSHLIGPVSGVVKELF